MTKVEHGRTARRLRWAGSLGWLGALAAAIAGVALSSDLRALVGGAAHQLSWAAVGATVPVQLAATLLCAGALGVLGPGVPFRASVLSRVLRDAGGNLLVFAPGLGEMVGARALVLSGGTGRAAVAATALDVLAETIAQVPFVVLALVVVPRMTAGWHVDPATVTAIGIGVAAALLFGGALLWVFRGRIAGPLAFARRQVGFAAAEWRQRRVAMPVATGLHLIAWLSGGIQVWLAARAMGTGLTLFDAIVIESTAYAIRGLLFVVPAGVGVQEAGFIVAGAALGLRQEQALALALVLRARDLLLGVPVLLLWPVLEWRGRGATSRAGDAG